MRFSPRCRVPAPSWLALLALSGCGGGGGPSRDAEIIADAVNCTFLNCTESSTLNVDEISARFTATPNASGDGVIVDGNLSKSANLLTVVLMAPDERLSTSVDGGSEVPMANPDGKRLHYTTPLRTSSATPVVRLVFTRAGVRHVSEVVVPAAFAVLQPTGSPAMTRTGAALPVRLTLPASGTTSTAANGSCSRADGSSFMVKNQPLYAESESGVAGGYRLSANAVHNTVTNASNSISATPEGTTPAAVSQCQLTIVWTRTNAGRAPATMNRHGYLNGESQATHPLTYDARS